MPGYMSVNSIVGHADLAGQVSVVRIEEGSHIVLDQAVDHIVVVIDTGRIHRSAQLGLDTSPGKGETKDLGPCSPISLE